jgi:DNA repair exonuclease SbcCD ATPase subunit
MQKRWTEIWAGGPLIMNGGGAFTLDVHGTKVPFTEFGGGERTVANVILRLLTLELVAHSSFAVVDEPIEHLDPKNRRLLASGLTVPLSRYIARNSPPE